MDSPVVLSVILVNWNVRELARKCLLSIEGQMQLPRDAYEVIVVDNASADGSVEMLRGEFPGITLIESKVNLGFGAGCNLGYRAAKGEYVLLLNPDTEVIDHAVDGLLDVMRSRPRAGILAPRLVNEDRLPQTAPGGAFPTLRNVAWNYLFLRHFLPGRLAPPALFLEGDPEGADGQGVIGLDWVSGASMLLRREAVGKQIFDESFFMFGEDMDVCDRVRQRGWDVLYSTRHAIVHHQGQSFAKQESLEIRAAAHRGPRRVFEKHHGRAGVFLYDSILLTGHLIRWPMYWILSLLRPGHGFGARSRYCKSYLRAMLHDADERPRELAGRK